MTSEMVCEYDRGINLIFGEASLILRCLGRGSGKEKP